MDAVLDIIYKVLTPFYIYVVVMVILVILSENRNPVKTLAWICVLTLLPLLGLVLYYFFGRDLRGKKIFSHKNTDALYVAPTNAISTQQIKHADLPSSVRKSMLLLKSNSGAIPYENSNIEPLVECKNTFERMFLDIEQAKDHIHIEFFILADDEIGNRLRRLLIKKAKEGVRVRVIYDYVGSYNLSEAYVKSMKNAGIYVVTYLPVGLRFGFGKINWRNHRKIIVLDGRIGYTGGVNIADRYVTGNRLGSWRDTMVRIEGAAVQGLQKVFLTDWYLVEGKQINAPKYYPKPQQFDTHNVVQIVMSGPDTEWPTILHGIVSAISNATKYIYIQSPYFVPPESILNALETAALGGVDVRLMIPRKSDTPVVAAASCSYFQRLMKSGVHVLFYNNNFLHSKTIVVDDQLTIIGSANMDNRSYEQNFEVAAFIYDEVTAKQLQQAFRQDMTQCDLLSLSHWQTRSHWKRFIESAARLLSPLM
ncbi:MAG: cardiolipin synthase [Bacteroidales bacterium]|nr:cardiolipin synthase [Bacteroidales bacterium]